MQRDEPGPTETQWSPHNIRLLWAGAFVSGLVATDLFLKLFCSSWPLVMHLAVGSTGAWAGKRLHRRFSAETIGATVIRRGAIGLAFFSAVGLLALFAMPVNWDTKCSWRHCGRALGPVCWSRPSPWPRPHAGDGARA